jgi:Fe-S-cluster containining protein
MTTPAAINYEPIKKVLRWFDKTLIECRQLKARQGEPVCLTCRKGCSACCSEQVIPTHAEVMLIVSTLDAEERAELTLRVQEWLARAQEIGLEAFCGPEPQFDATTYRKFHLECPLLKDGLCSVYEHRPLSCRMFLTGGPREACEDLELRPRQKFLTIVELNNTAYEAMVGAAQRAGFTSLGLSHLGYLLAIALGLVNEEKL